MIHVSGGSEDVAVIWKLVLLVGGGALGVIVLIGLLSLLGNSRTRGKAALLLLLAVLIFGGFVRTARVVQGLRSHDTEEARAQMAMEAMLRPHAPGDAREGDVTVVLSPPDAADAGKAPDDRISVKIQKDQRTGKGTIIYIKANRMLEAFGKTLLDTIRHSTEKETQPAKSAAPAPTQAFVAASAISVPGGNSPPAKAAAATPSKPSPAGTVKRTPTVTAKPATAPPKRTPPAEGAYEETVTAYGKTEPDCEATLDDELQQAVSRYVERRLGLEAAEQVHLPAGEIRQWIASKSRENAELKELGPMVRLSAVLRCDKAFDDRIDQEWAKARLSERLWYVGGGLGGVLLLLSVVYGYLKIDLATGGAYRWRLRLAAAAILLGMVAAGVAFVPR